MGVKMDLRIITKNHAADPEIGFSQNCVGVNFLSSPCEKFTIIVQLYIHVDSLHILFCSIYFHHNII